MEQMPLRVQLAQGGNVGRVEERARLTLTRVPERPDALAVGGRHRALERIRNSVLAGDFLDEPNRLLDGGRGVGFEAEAQREEEQHLGISLTLDLRVERRVDSQNQITLDRPELIDVSVVHEQPVVVAKRVAVGLLHRAADRRADVSEEQRGGDVAGELAQVLVVPRWLGAAIDTRGVGGAVPADTEPITVGRLSAEPRVQTLADQRVRPFVQRVFQQDRRSGGCKPATHWPLLSVGLSASSAPRAGTGSLARGMAGRKEARRSNGGG